MNTLIRRTILSPLATFFRTEQVTGYLLMISVALAILMVNTPLASIYHHFTHFNLGITLADRSFVRDLHWWVNDGLMALFFLLIGLEIKREIVTGELSSFQKSFLPIAAALGGMIAPALIYYLVNAGLPTVSGWGIPIATDIAFALGILSILGKKIPLSLKVFLAALAIVDDLGAILVIAIFYTDHILLHYVVYAATTFFIMLLMNRLKVLNFLFYFPFGILLWYFTYKSGIHATIAGVLMAFTIPLIRDDKRSPLEKLEHALHQPIGYIVMPLFAFVNTGIAFSAGMIGGIYSSAGLGIILGLLIGKPLGILTFSWIAVRTGIASLPAKVNWRQIIGVGFLGGIGFTMSIFIALLSFSSLENQEIAKISILAASILSGLVGFFILKRQKTGKETGEGTGS
jgi:NhaA family Na+:H+ antiporter